MQCKILPYQGYNVRFQIQQVRFHKGRQFGFSDTKHTQPETYGEHKLHSNFTDISNWLDTLLIQAWRTTKKKFWVAKEYEAHAKDIKIQ